MSEFVKQFRIVTGQSVDQAAADMGYGTRQWESYEAGAATPRKGLVFAVLGHILVDGNPEVAAGLIELMANRAQSGDKPRGRLGKNNG